MENLIVVKQLPIIEEQLRTLKERWEQRAFDAESMVCTLDTVQAVKEFRAEMRKEFEEAETLRKAAKKAIMEPYDQLEEVYRERVTAPFQKADRALSGKVIEVERDIKARCEDGLRDYFAELCAVHHLDWLSYEQAGVKVDLASAKAKTPKKLREQLSAFVAGVAESVDRINTLEDADQSWTMIPPLRWFAWMCRMLQIAMGTMWDSSRNISWPIKLRLLSCLESISAHGSRRTNNRPPWRI